MSTLTVDALGEALLLLNPQQRAAALDSLDVNSLVIAGAGSGKTATKTVRLAYLIQERQVPAYRVLLLTFTNKAAKEMIERMAVLIGEEEARKVMAGTFHSVCVKLLRRPEALPHLGFAKPFVIADQSDSSTMIKEILKDLGTEYDKQTVKGVQGKISSWKNELMTATDVEEYLRIEPGGPSDVLAWRVYIRYQARLKKNSSVDFDDIIMKTVQLLQTVPDFRDYCHQRFHHLSVDEFQDTNTAQLELVKALKSPTAVLFVVGDDFQSIYGWRGAQIKNILEFGQTFSAKVFKLEQNYRSTQTIVSAANALVKNNHNQMDKHCFSKREQGDPICVYTGMSAAGEAQFVASEIRNLVQWSGYKLNDFAVLYRTSWLTRAIEEQLTKYKVPYEVVNGLAFYERMVIKDSVSLLTLAMNPDESMSARRILTKLTGVSATTLKKAINLIEPLADQLDASLLAAAQIWVQTSKGKARDAIANFLVKWPAVAAIAADGQPDGISRTLRAAWESIGYQAYVKAESESKEIYDDNVGNLREFWRLTRDWEQQPADNGLYEFLENIALVSQVDKKDDGEKVRLQTLHSSKGLEFPVVFMVGMEEGIFPSKNALTPPQMEEERRLAYVGVTRAKTLLYMTNARERKYFSDMMYNRPSRFIYEVPDQYKSVV